MHLKKHLVNQILMVDMGMANMDMDMDMDMGIRYLF